MRTMVGRRMLFLATSIVHLFVDPNTALAEAGVGDAAAARQLPFPASIESVIARGDIEGYPVAVVRFRSRLPAGEALALTKHAWRRGTTSVVATTTGAWQIVSVYEADRYRTLQLRPTADGGSDGLLSVWEGARRGAAFTDAGYEPSRVLPPGARVLRTLVGVDAGRRHRTLVAVADGSPAWIVQAIDARITAQGFARDPVARKTGESGPPGEARLYRGAGVTLAVTVHPQDARTAIVMHFTESDR